MILFFVTFQNFYYTKFKIRVYSTTLKIRETFGPGAQSESELGVSVQDAFDFALRKI